MLVGWLNAVGMCVASSLLEEATVVVVAAVASVPLDSVAAELFVSVLLAVILGT